MTHKVLTVAREYGSGGAEIAGLVAQQLGWKLLDRDLIDKIAHTAGVDPDVARACDEHVDSWLHRIGKPLWRGDVAAVATLTPVDIFDAEGMARLAHDLIEEAAAAGNCVIVGRGGQCALRARPDVFHVFVYAPWADRMRRIEQRAQGKANAERLIRKTDTERAAYVRLYFGQDWSNPHLYDLMINSQAGCQAVASTILCAMEGQA